MTKNAFYFMLKALPFLRYLKVCLAIFGHVGKRLDEKAKVNHQIFDITTWRRSNNNTHIGHYLKKERQSDNEIWSVNRI